jgi:hypothetical protein
VTARSLRLIAASTQYLSRTAVQANNTATVLAGWVRIASYPASGYAMIAGLSRAFTGAALQINTTGQLSLRDYNTEGVTAGSTLALDRWYYLWFRVPLGTGTSSVYLDGNVVPDASRTVTYASGSNPLLRLGARYNAPTSPFDGWFARWRMWAADISASQVRVERYALRAMQRASLVGDWWMDGSPDVYDHGGAGRTLSVTGGPLSPSGVILGEFRPARRVVVRVTAGGAVQLVVEDLAVAAALDAIALTQANQLAVADLAVAAALDAPALTQANVLDVAGLDVAATLEAVGLTQAHVLAVASLAVAGTLDTIALTQAGQLTVADLLVAAGIEDVTLQVAGELAPADLTVAATLDAPALTQANQLAVEDLAVAVTLEPVTVTTGTLLEVAALAVATVLDGVALTQANQLAPADLLVAANLEAPALVQAHVLTVGDLLVAVVLDGVVLVLPAGFDRALLTDFTLAAPQLAAVAVAGPQLADVTLRSPRLTSITVE